MADRVVSRRDALRFGLSAVAGTGALATLTGCGATLAPKGGPGTPGPANAEPKGKLRLLYQGGAEEQAAYQQLFDKFEKKYPKVKIEAIADPSTSWADFFTNVQVKIAGGQRFDVIYIPTEGQQLFASKGLIQPIDRWVERDKEYIEEFESDVDPRLLQHARRLASPDEHTYFIPFVFNPMCMYFRRSLVRKAGVTPKPDWHWDDFREAAEATTRKGTYGFNANPQDFAGIEPWVLTNGGSILNRNWTRSAVASPKAIEAVTFTRRLVADGISPKPGGTFDENVAFGQGQIAMIGSGRWVIQQIRLSKIVDDVEIVPWPAKARQGSPIGWGSIGIMKGSYNKDTAWAFVKHLLGKETQDLVARIGFNGAIPARRSSSTGPPVLKNSPRGTEYLYEALRYSTPVPGPERSNVIQQATMDTYLQILAGALKPAEGMHQLDEAIRAAL